MPHAQPCRLWIVLLCGSKIKEKQSKKKKINISQAQSHASDSSLLNVHLGSLQLINGRLHCFAAGPWPSLFVQVITFQNEGGCAIWELGFFFFMAGGLNYFSVQTRLHKIHLQFLCVISCSLQCLVWVSILRTLLCSSLSLDGPEPFSLMYLSPPNLQSTKVHNACCKTIPKGSESLQGLHQGNWWVMKNMPAEFSFWVKIPKRALNIYIPSFCRKTGHNLEAHIYF